MTSAHNMIELPAIKHFIFAGRSTFTLVSKKTGTRFTYKCASGRDNINASFVRVRTSNDHWTFVGTIFDKTNYVHSRRKTHVLPDAESIIALKWFLRMINQNRLPDSIEFWHEGTCGKCGRQLTVPSSIESGIGPICAALNPHNKFEVAREFFKPLGDDNGTQHRQYT